MIHEHHEDIPDEFRVSVQPVHPFTDYPTCPKCNGSLGAHIPILRRLFAAWGRAAQNMAYCKGSQNSEVHVPTINILNGQMGVSPVNVPCFGIFHEHIHLTCGRCRFDWLMNCKGGK